MYPKTGFLERNLPIFEEIFPKTTISCIFLPQNLLMSKKSSTFAASKLKYQRQPDELPQACGIFYALPVVRKRI